MTLRPPLVSGPRSPQQSPEGIAVGALRFVAVSVLPSSAEEGTVVVLQSTGELHRRFNGQWWPIGSGGGGVSEDYTHPEHPEIETITDALDYLLTTNLTANGITVSPSVVEKGAVVSSVSLAWGWNKDPTSQSVSGPGGGAVPASQRALTLSGLSLTSNTSWTVTGVGESGPLDQIAALSFRSRRYWGASANPLFLPTALAGSELATSRVKSVEITCSGQYLCFAWPVAFGQPRFYVGGFLDTAWEERTVPFTNLLGHTEDYLLYRSTYLQHGAAIPVSVQ